ncbi:TetR/AcrR family transcriptional regulator [Streptomyces sp. GTA36]
MSPGDQHSDASAAQPVRSDVERNRGRILAAARTVFGRDGLGASMASVARETGVGIATVFRHFPTKEALVAAVFSDRMDAYADAVATALEDPDPWHGFTGYIEAACAMQAADNGFADVLTMTFPTARAMEKRRNEAYEGMVRLIGRGQGHGPTARRLRPFGSGTAAHGQPWRRQRLRRRRSRRLAACRRLDDPVLRGPGPGSPSRLARP